MEDDRRLNRTRWVPIALETLTLVLFLSLIGGGLLGIVHVWEHLDQGFHLLSVSLIVSYINKSIPAVLLLFFLFIPSSMILRRVIRDVRWYVSIAGTVASIPFLLFCYNRIDRPSLLRTLPLGPSTLDVLIVAGLAVMCLLVVFLLYRWTLRRIQGDARIPIKSLCVLLGMLLMMNLATLFLPKARGEEPNVVILLVDCLRANHMSCYGYQRDTTPNIEKLVQDSVVFTQAVSQSTFTKTSVASLFTSRYPYQHQVYVGSREDRKNHIVSDVLSANERTLAEVLLANGVYTGAWIQQRVLSAFMGFSQGFFEYNERQGGIDQINRKFLKWIDGVGRLVKFFAYVHYNDLHDPYRPKPPYDTLYGTFSEDVYEGIDFKNWGFHLREMLRKERELDEEDVLQLEAYYDGQLTYIDNEIGRLLQSLKDRGIFDQSLIILTADHGDGFMEHDFISHHNAPYEELVRVPLIMKFPGSRFKGMVVDRQVRLVDVMPTILDFWDIPPSKGLEGFSLLNCIDGERKASMEGQYPEYAVSEYKRKLAIRTERYKFLRIPGEEDVLFDLSVDHGEQHNVIDRDQEVAETFRRLAEIIASQKEAKKEDRVVLDQDTIEELKELGYIR